MTPKPSPRPLRCAAIDVGSNAVRFVAAESIGPDRWIEVEARRVPIRLGHGAFREGALEAKALRGTVAAMAMFRRRMDAHGVLRYRAVATSAVRESRNGDELVGRAWRDGGIRLETIAAAEEARLVSLAVRSRVDLGDGDWVLADLGGGSLEISRISADGIEWTESHPTGTVRLLQDLPPTRTGPDDVRAMVAERTRAARMRDLGDGEPARGLVAIGGNIEALAKLAGRARDPRGVALLPLEDLRRLIELLGGLSVEQRIERLDLRRDRADVILPAALVYEHVAARAGFDAFVVPHVGVKEGILLDLGASPP